VAELPSLCQTPSVQGRELLRLLVVGCGNPLAGDDSAGVEIVRRLEDRSDPALRDQFRTVPSAGVALLETFSAADVVLFIDAVSSGAPPGTLHLIPLLPGEIEPRALGSLSSHGWGLPETLELARSLGRRVPNLMLLGLEVGEVSLGASRSQAVEQAITLVVERFAHLRSLLVDSASPAWRLPHRFLPGSNCFLEE
jgi:hydrogenase maturation protease